MLPASLSLAADPELLDFGPSFLVGEWSSHTGHPVDTVLCSTTWRIDGKMFVLPSFYFHSRPVAIFDEPLEQELADHRRWMGPPRRDRADRPRPADIARVLEWRGLPDRGRTKDPPPWLTPRDAWEQSCAFTQRLAVDDDLGIDVGKLVRMSFERRTPKARLRGLPGEMVEGEMTCSTTVGWGRGSALFRVRNKAPRQSASVGVARLVLKERKWLQRIWADAPWVGHLPGLHAVLQWALGGDSCFPPSAVLAAFAGRPPSGWRLPKEGLRETAIFACRNLRLRRSGASERHVVQFLGRWSVLGKERAWEHVKTTGQWIDRAHDAGCWDALIPLWDHDVGNEAFAGTATERLADWLAAFGSTTLPTLLAGRASRLRLLGETPGVTSPGVLCDRGSWRIAPHSVPSAPWITGRLELRAEWERDADGEKSQSENELTFLEK